MASATTSWLAIPLWAVAAARLRRSSRPPSRRACGRPGPRASLGAAAPSVSTGPAPQARSPPTPAPWARPRPAADAALVRAASVAVELPATGDVAMGADETADRSAPPIAATRLAELRERVTVLRLFSDLAPQVAAAEAEVAVLVAAERAGCPLPRRLQFAVDILRAREAKARQAREAADQATSAAEAAEAQRRHSAGHGGRGRGAGSTPGTTAGRGRGAAAAGMAPPAGAIGVGDSFDAVAAACGALLGRTGCPMVGCAGGADNPGPSLRVLAANDTS
jgi:hypothetical protein